MTKGTYGVFALISGEWKLQYTFCTKALADQCARDVADQTGQTVKVFVKL